ncbi:hypothetical protein ABZU76_34845 [Amycolatopsis sp. NPDC005232]
MQVRAAKGDLRSASRKRAEVDAGRGKAVGGDREGVIAVGSAAW